MSEQVNIQILKRWFEEVWNQGHHETVHELLSPDAKLEGQNGSGSVTLGPLEFIRFAESIRSQFTGIHVSLDDTFAAGEKVVARWSATMVYKGGVAGLAPAGTKVQITGISIGRVVGGKIVEGWDNWDRLALLQQIGAYQPPVQAPLEKSA